jgi:hypothetical protein
LIKFWVVILLVPIVLGLAGCGNAAALPDLPTLAAAPPTAVVDMPVTAVPDVTATLTPSPVTPILLAPAEPSATPAALLPSSTPALAAPSPTQDWQELPVIPSISEKARLIYQRGQALGNNPRAFSKVGDCESRAVWFLSDFDQGSKAYSLGPYADLQNVIDIYHGSFARLSQAAQPSFNAASLMSPLWADPQACQKNETALACEYRLWKPSVALVMLGTNDTPRPETFEGNLRKIIEYSLDQGVLPVLATKADNLEGDQRINATIARVARAYDLPLWNYWLAMKPLPRHGLQEDGAHLTLGANNFADPAALKTGWAVRNLTALQVLDAVWRGVQP